MAFCPTLHPNGLYCIAMQYIPGLFTVSKAPYVIPELLHGRQKCVGTVIQNIVQGPSLIHTHRVVRISL
jgi:hypothetical protein